MIGARLRQRALALACGALLLHCGDGLADDLQRASDLFYRGQVHAAERLYGDTLQRLRAQPPSPRRRAQILQAWRRLAQLHALYLRDTERAIADYAAIANAYPGEADARGALAALGDLYLNRQHDPAAAIAAYHRLVADFSDHPDARRAQLAIVHAYLKQQDQRAATQQAEILARRHPGSAEALEGRVAVAYGLSLQAQPAAAAAAFAALAEAPLSPPQQALLSVERASCYQRLDQPHRALEQLEQALATHPQPRLVQSKIGHLRAAIHRQSPASFQVARRRS